MTAILPETPRERMRIAMAGGRPARVPVMCQMSIGHMLIQGGVRPEELWFDEDAFIETLRSLRARYEFDGILISLHGQARDWARGIVEIVREDAGARVRWADGSVTLFPPDDLPLHRPAQDIRRPALERFSPDSLPDAPDYIPVSQGLRFALDPGNLTGIHRRLREGEGQGLSLHGEVTSPLDYFLDLFGFAEGFLALAEDPARAKAVLEKLAAGVARLGAGQARAGVDAVKISSPFAGAGFLSPRHYREFVVPYERIVARAIQAEGAFAYTHTCGAIGDRLELMAESEVAGLECLDPPPLGNVELEDALDRIGSRMFIKGNVDPVHTLLFGDPARIAADVRYRVDLAAPRGGFILSTACSIAPRTPPENVLLLVSQVHLHKSY
ncbi:MAG: hypothetical protein NTZ26_13875 [Candidatus Aminicenantes bacterium]|nr:hypothetical protein [Candidatus Aminicenantes bacterium]